MSFKIVFMGTPEFSMPALEALINNKFEILSIYTQSPKKSKRSSKSGKYKKSKYSFEGVCFNSRHPGPRRVWKGGSEEQLLPPLPEDPLDQRACAKLVFRLHETLLLAKKSPLA